MESEIEIKLETLESLQQSGLEQVKYGLEI